MNGTMMDAPLLLTHLLERAGGLFAGREIVSRLADGTIHRTNYGEFYRRARRLGAALVKAGMKPGDRVATLAWNHWRHLECYFGIPCAGGVLHTVNLRLFPEQVAYILDHAEDKFLLIDESLLPMAEKVCRDAKTIEKVVVMASTPGKWAGRRRDYVDYESFLAKSDKGFEYPELKETDAAGMCYTSGTTGEPKGVVYTHRSTCLHSLATSLADTIGVGMHETVMPVVPMFHANAWGLPFAAVMTGAKQVFPGPDLSAPSVARLMADEGVTLAAGVPTVWGGVLDLLDREGGKYDLGKLHTLVVGGSAAPRHQIVGFQERHGIRILHAWGMTETSPIGTLSRVKPTLPQTPGPEHYAYRAKQGMPVPFVEVRAVDESGDEIPKDGETLGDLQVRGPWITGGYFRNAKAGKAAITRDGWFRTGDVVTVDAEGYMKIADRTKDLIKSGGEWISSVDLENHLMAHPAVAEACVIAVPDPKWDERPLACVVLKPGAKAQESELQAHLAAHFAKWQLPDRYEFVKEIPKTSVGKFDKKALRAKMTG